MFCSACGETLQETFKYCPKCGKHLENNLNKPKSKAKDEVKHGKELSFKEFREKNEKQRATFFRGKPGKGKTPSGRQEDLSDTVKINVGIMVPDGQQLRKVRGKALQLSVPKNCTADMLLKAGVDKHRAHSKDIIMQEIKYVLLYEDCTEVKTLKESTEEFVLHKYKNECGKPYHRLNFFLCAALEYSMTTLERCIRDIDEGGSVSSEDERSESESGLEEVIPIKKQKLSRTRKQDSDDDLPSMLNNSPGTSNSETTQNNVESQGGPFGSCTVYESPDHKLSTLRDMFPNEDQDVLQRALAKTDSDINLAIGEILDGRSAALPVLSPQGIYASLNFCNDVTGDEEFEEGVSDITSRSVTSTHDNKKHDEGTFNTSLEKLASDNVKRDIPLRMKVRRSNIWEDSKLKLGKCTDADLHNIVRVQFVGEPAVDQGGPRNEYFTLLHKGVSSSSMFTGSENCKLFNHDLLALEQRNYFMYGQLCSLAIMQGSPAPSFFSPTVADYIVFGELSRAQTSIDDVCNAKVRDKLKELKSIEDPKEFKEVASFQCPLRFKAGFNKPIVTIDDKVKMLHVIALHYTLVQSLAEVNQFIEGLKLNGLLECLRQHPYEARKLFLYKENKISGEQLDDLLVPSFSLPGSNKRKLEESVSFNFTRYLEDVEAGKIKGAIEDFDTREKSEIVITGGMVLQFITGSPQIPALQFDPLPSVQFLHDDPGRKMTANTCSNTLTLPVSAPYLDYELFQVEFTSCLLDSPGFGKV